MIEYLFLAVGCTGVALIVAAVRYGHSAADAARLLVEGSGVRRITARQARHHLRLAQHELAGASEYIAGLEQDRTALSAELEKRTGELHEARAENSRLRVALAPRPVPVSPAYSASALPDAQQEFADETRTAWRARA